MLEIISSNIIAGLIIIYAGFVIYKNIKKFKLGKCCGGCDSGVKKCK